MSELHLNPTEVSQWVELVSDAEQACNQHLDDDLKSYLVFLLMRYIGAAELAASILALDYLESLEIRGRLQADKLSEVGDKCLLFSGLFPGRAQRRRVSISYYVKLGATAYATLADAMRGASAAMYIKLARRFVPLMDILNATRELDSQFPALQPLQAMELWNDTGSAHAYATLRRYSTGTPVRMLVTPEPGSRRRKDLN
jgi:hypothetical protein